MAFASQTGRVTPRVTLNWEIRPDLSVYAQYAHGNSPGGFNKIQAPKSTYDEEKLINYEIGLKTSGFGFSYLGVSAFWLRCRALNSPSWSTA